MTDILPGKYFADCKNKLRIDIGAAWRDVDTIGLSPRSFTFYTSVAVISSSRIEGEKMEVDSYLKHKMQHIEYLPELVQKPNDLYKAYLFAGKHKLTLKNFKQSHQLLSQHLLPEKWRGIYRKNPMVVLEHKTGKIQFEAAPQSILEMEMNKLFADIKELTKQELAMEKVFYYASLLHLTFVCIHPFNDGNGRAGRLLEKWFLAEVLGKKAWYVQSEKYYYRHVNEYYRNLNLPGMFYKKIDYAKANRFFQMLPNAINYKD